MPKTLRIWNGRGILCRKYDDARWDDMPRPAAPHAYVAAYSRADARRVIEEYCGKLPPDSELATYFTEGAWGNAMNGITPERGLWLTFERNKPTRVV